MPQVAAVLTNWTDRAQFAQDVFDAFVRVGLPPQGAALFTAHSALSTGWGKSTWNWNLAGLKLCSGCEDKYNWAELTNAKTGVLTKWRAFNSIDDGVQALWNNLQASRYDSARALLLVGDTEYFAEVGRNGWYEEDPATTKAQMLPYLAYISKVVGVAMPASGAGGPLVAIAVGLATWWLLRRYL